MNDAFWAIFNRNMRVGVHHTHGDTRSKDVNAFIYWLKVNNKWVKRGTILNVGIGDGEEALIFKRAKLHVIGISNSQDEADCARAQGVDAYKMDAHQLTFPDESFDYVYLHDTMEHFIAPVMVFTQFRRVLVDGGILGFHYPTIEQSHDWTHWFIESPRLLFDWLLKFGFKLLHFAYTPQASSEYLYIAEKCAIAQDENERGGNVIYDMLRELREYNDLQQL